MANPRLPDGLPKSTWRDEEYGVALYRGDCLGVLPGLPTGSVDAEVTDPPYGIDYQSARRIDPATRKPKIDGDSRPFIWAFAHNDRLLSARGCVFAFCRWDTQEAFRLALEWSGIPVRSQVIWDRQWHGLGDLERAWGPRHDSAWFAARDGFAFEYGRPQSVLAYKRIAAENLVHPTEKPQELLDDIVGRMPAGTVLDPFMGSGTTGVACVGLGRAFIGIEIEPKYFDIAVERIRQAIIDKQDGPLFAEHQPEELFAET